MDQGGERDEKVDTNREASPRLDERVQIATDTEVQDTASISTKDALHFCTRTRSVLKDPT